MLFSHDEYRDDRFLILCLISIHSPTNLVPCLLMVSFNIKLKRYYYVEIHSTFYE